MRRKLKTFKKMENSEIGHCSDSITFLIATGVVIFIYWLLLYAIGKKTIPQNDFMNIKIFNIESLENCCSLWPISHFVLFAILGYKYPTCDAPILLLGVLWELFEMIWSNFVKEERQYVIQNDTLEYSSNWWAGSFKDILFNVAGFYFGKVLSKI